MLRKVFKNVNTENEFHFFLGSSNYELTLKAMGPLTYFGWNPFHSYFDEPQKNKKKSIS